MDLRRTNFSFYKKCIFVKSLIKPRVMTIYVAQVRLWCGGKTLSGCRTRRLRCCWRTPSRRTRRSRATTSGNSASCFSCARRVACPGRRRPRATTCATRATCCGTQRRRPAAPPACWPPPSSRRAAGPNYSSCWRRAANACSASWWSPNPRRGQCSRARPLREASAANWPSSSTTSGLLRSVFFFF